MSLDSFLRRQELVVNSVNYSPMPSREVRIEILINYSINLKFDAVYKRKKSTETELQIFFTGNLNQSLIITRQKSDDKVLIFVRDTRDGKESISLYINHLTMNKHFWDRLYEPDDGVLIPQYPSSEENQEPEEGVLVSRPANAGGAGFGGGENS
jgi:hypothetical protein